MQGQEEGGIPPMGTPPIKDAGAAPVKNVGIPPVKAAPDDNPFKHLVMTARQRYSTSLGLFIAIHGSFLPAQEEIPQFELYRAASQQGQHFIVCITTHDSPVGNYTELGWLGKNTEAQRLAAQVALGDNTPEAFRDWVDRVKECWMAAGIFRSVHR
ncbi:hypothetical protein P154DRAFT_540334 [Amniculicola lignicola CBS 123094]|uniref:Uncharacterized protein n=1 Tax=Amniculicola lignicola CBS 123094 TaxID=1392246 RepID=A0A6A5VXZ5_9PLEO|nr:hypothetical protein P154DRAFT_540334 [Amniculicola lignicola CBS 123094]